MAAHETLNKIKKDSAFVESIFAAKAKREEPEEIPVVIECVEEKTSLEEVSHRPDDMEEIIRVAEEAAYMDAEK